MIKRFFSAAIIRVRPFGGSWRRGCEILLCLVFALIAWVRLQAAPRIDARYDIIEWLISYDGGFVRRGLMGDFIGLLAEAGVNPLFAIRALCLISFIVFSSLLLMICRGRFRLSLVLSPVLLLAPLSQGFFYKKDSLLMACYLLWLLLLQSDIAKATVGNGGMRSLPDRLSRILPLNILGCFLVLAHEAMYLLLLPSTLIMVSLCAPYHGLRTKIGLAVSILAIPGGLWLAFVGPYRGGTEQVSLIREGFERLWLRYGELNWLSRLDSDQSIDALSFLSLSMRDGLDMSLFAVLRRAHMNVPEIVIWFTLLLLIIGLILSGMRDGARRLSLQATNDGLRIEAPILLLAIFLIQFFFALPLFAVAMDWGRWLFFVSVSCVSVYCLVVARLEVIGLPRWPCWLAWLSRSSPRRCLPCASSLSRFLPSPVLLLFVGVPMVDWNVYGAIAAMPVHDLWRLLRYGL